MNELTALWQSFTLTGDPKQYLKFKQLEGERVLHGETSHQRKEEYSSHTNWLS